MTNEISWAWYLARSSALVGFFLLYISIFLGLSIRTPLLKRVIKPIYSLKVHSWISLQAFIFAMIHGGSLLFDKFLNFNLGNILVPFYPLTDSQLIRVSPAFLALGTISFYIMIVLVASSYLRNSMSYGVWRGIHSLNAGLYVVSIIHALYLGTDLKSAGAARDIFIYANAFLIFIFAFNIFFRFGRMRNNNTSRVQ